MYDNAAFLAAFLLIYSAIAGRIERSLISGPIVFTVAGLLLGPDGLGVLRIDISGEGFRLLAELTLAMVLFTDAANADFGVVRANLGLPERLLGVGLPLTIVLGFLCAASVFCVPLSCFPRSASWRWRCWRRSWHRPMRHSASRSWQIGWCRRSCARRSI